MMYSKIIFLKKYDLINLLSGLDNNFTDKTIMKI